MRNIFPLFLFSLCLSACPFGANALAYPDSLLGRELRQQALVFLENGQLDSMRHYQSLAAGIFQKNDDLWNWLELYKTTGTQLRNIDSLDLAFQTYFFAMENAWQQPRDSAEKVSIAWLKANIGYAYRLQNDYESVANCYGEAAEIFEALGRDDYEVGRFVYGQLGNAYNRLRDYERAEIFHLKRKNICRKAEQWDAAAGASNDLGMVYQNLEDFPAAIAAFSEGLTFPGVDEETMVLLLSNLAQSYQLNQQPELALQANRQCEQRLRKIELDPADRQAYQVFVHENYAAYHQSVGEFPAAEKHFTTAMKLVGDAPRELALLTLRRGNLYLNWERPDAALPDFRSATQLLAPDFRKKNTDTRHIPTEPNLVEAFSGQGTAHMQLYRKNGDLSELEQALDAFQQAGQVEGLLLEKYTLDGSRLAAARERRNVRESTLAAAHEMWQNDPTSELSTMLFAWSELSRASLLIESASVAQTLQDRGVDDSLRTQFYECNQVLSDLEMALRKPESLSASELDKLRSQRLKTKDAKAAIVEQILASRPDSAGFFQKKYAVLRNLQGQLSRGQMLIEYFVGQERLFTFSVSAAGFQAWEMSLPPDFHPTIDSLRNVLTERPNGSFQKNKPVFARCSHRLYGWLLEKPLSQKPAGTTRLLIVPDGRLGHVPFDLLLEKMPPDDYRYAELDYVLRHFAIGYAPSAELWLLQSQRPPGMAELQFAGFAPSYANRPVASLEEGAASQLRELDRAGEYDLQGTKQEVRFVADLLQGDAFLDERAGESFFKKTAGRYRILLLAMHSIVDEDSPAFSRLMFTHGTSSDANDDLLHAHELGTLPLQADLAVLSACNTGYGKLLPGEGVMSLSGSFFSAGVPSTVMTLWKIPDRTSPLIVQAFFENLKNGMPKDLALQQAKLSYLDEHPMDDLGQPYCWSGFIVAGNLEPMVLETGWPWWAWALLALAAFGAVFFLLYRRA